jgi:hypothetical protein
MTQGRIRIDGQFLWYDIWKGVSTERLRDNDIDEFLLDDLHKAKLTTDDIKTYTWIVNTESEGHSANDIENFRKLLLTYGLPSTNFGAIFTAYEDTEKLCYPAVCLTDKMIYNTRWYRHLQNQNVDWANLAMNATFTVLMRRASIMRCQLAKRLLQKFEPYHMIMTLGTTPGIDANQYKDAIHPYSYPIIVDHKEVNEEQHNPKHELFYNAPIQLVVESSDQTDIGVWRNIFITEKSYKAFAWHQFPLWYAVPGLVSKLRDVGFDLFDDIINHSYDNEQNPWTRMIAVVQEMQNLVRKGCKDLRQEHWQRLESNARLVDQIHTNARIEHQKQTNRLINELQLIH